MLSSLSQRLSVTRVLVASLPLGVRYQSVNGSNGG